VPIQPDGVGTHFLTGRYRAADLESVPEAEVRIQLDGRIVLTGIGGAFLVS
jgi:hypothetical protein